MKYLMERTINTPYGGLPFWCRLRHKWGPWVKVDSIRLWFRRYCQRCGSREEEKQVLI